MQETIFSYSNYRSFMRDYAQDCRARKKSWSLGGWARHLDLKGTSSLTMILNGQRHPGPEMIRKLCAYFKFNAKERTYFTNLVKLSKGPKDPDIALLLREKLGEINPHQKTQFLNEQEFAVLASWLPFTLREMTTLKGFVPTTDWIKGHLKFSVSKPQIRQALKDLKALNLVTGDERGRLRSTKASLNTVADVASVATRRYQSQTLNLALKSLQETPVEERDFSTLTLTMKKDKLHLLKTKINAFMDHIQEDFECEAGDATFQVQIQAFPLTKAIQSQ